MTKYNISIETEALAELARTNVDAAMILSYMQSGRISDKQLFAMSKAMFQHETIGQVNDYLHEQGYDPAEVAQRGRELIERLMDEYGG